jgi:hypothetical protein
METQLQHDPRTKQQIKDGLYEYIYAPVERKMKAQLEAIITKNCVLQTAGHRSFSYKSILYVSDTSPPPRKATRLHKTLHPYMDVYLQELKHLNETETPYVLGAITSILNSSNDLCDYLAVLPDSIHTPIKRFIASCPCRSKHLTEEEVLDLQRKNAQPLQLIKNRLITNLIT